MFGYLPFLAWFVLLLVSLLDIDRTPDGATRGLSPSGWFLVVVLVPIAGALAWLVGGRPRSGPCPAGAPAGVVGPSVDRVQAQPTGRGAGLQAILDQIDREFDEAVRASRSHRAIAPRERSGS